MPSGIEIINPSGRVQIDSGFSALRLIRTGTTVRGSGWTGANDWRNSANVANVQCPSGRPTVLIRTGALWVSQNIYIDGDLGFFTAGDTPDRNESYGVEYAVFDYSGGDFGASNFGLQIFREDGQLAYDSLYTTLNIVSVIDVASYNEYTGPGSEQTAIHPPVSSPWFIMGGSAGGLAQEIESGIFLYFGPVIKTLNSQTVAYTRGLSICPSFGASRAGQKIIVCSF
jgi:hypothetical protein